MSRPQPWPTLLLVAISALFAYVDAAYSVEEAWFQATKGDANSTWSRRIVRFRSYEPQDMVHAQLHDILHHGHVSDACQGWRVVPRDNPAARFPTDFAVVTVAPEAIESVTATLVAHPSVRDVNADRVLRIPLGLSTSSPPLPGGPAHGDVASDATVSKPSGRLRTRWTLDDADSNTLHDDAVAGKLLRRDSEMLQERFVAHARVGSRTDAGRPLSPDRRTAALADCGVETSANGTCGHSASGRALLEAWGPLLWGAGGDGDDGAWAAEAASRRRLHGTTQVTTALAAPELWKQGYSGKGIRVGVFDTGIREGHPHIRNLRERSNWTHENTLSDELGHGTFVAGVIGGAGSDCLGFAPDVLLHTFKVFTNDQVSFTSWFLDAFNYAIATEMQIVNLSIGGPDFLDAPFVDKVQEITAAGVIMVSAIGNDGPLYGTLNNPADQLDVLGVGGLDFADHIASFSSRGMSTWQLPTGWGGAKPDVMAYGREVRGSKIGGGCRALSGTSVASPVVAGAVALLASAVPAAARRLDSALNPASMKQALVEGAVRLPGLNIFEQGAGKIDLPASKAILQAYEPRASVLPAALDFTDCPYMWPYCLQPFYAGAQPIVFNATVLNGMGVYGELTAPPTFAPADAGGALLDVLFEWSAALWPWSGHLSVFVRVKDAGAAFEGNASGIVSFTVESPPAPGEAAPRRSSVALPLRAAIIPTPPRASRLLWDQYHSVKYPPAYLPRDNLEVRSDILDWHGDHLATNYHALYTAMRAAGAFVEVLASPATCFDAAAYGALILADPEDEFYPAEVAKLAADVKVRGLGLLLFPEWYSLEAMGKMRFFDDNTRSWWLPATGGSNAPALNDLLAPHGLAFGDAVVHGTLTLGAHSLPFSSGTFLARAPAGARLLVTQMQNRSSTGGSGKAASGTSIPTAALPVLGLLRSGAGRIAAYGDASCVDSNHAERTCHAFVHELFVWAGGGEEPEWAKGDVLTTLAEASPADAYPLPERPRGDLLRSVSHVLNNPLRCYLNSAVGFQDALKAAPKASPAVSTAVFGDLLATDATGGPARSHARAAAAEVLAPGSAAVAGGAHAGSAYSGGADYLGKGSTSSPSMTGTLALLSLVVLPVLALVWLATPKKRGGARCAPSASPASRTGTSRDGGGVSAAPSASDTHAAVAGTRSAMQRVALLRGA